MGNKAGVGIGIGGISMLAIFVVLCLTTLAVLSLVSARADLTLMLFPYMFHLHFCKFI